MPSKNFQTPEIRMTTDGSTTLYLPEMDEHYHSIHGAIQESMHVFIKAGLWEIKQQKLSILEMGFGTGLNALMTLLFAKHKIIRYHALELYPMPTELAGQLNYPVLFEEDNALEIFNQMHQSKWDELCTITPGFDLLKMKQDLLTYQPDTLFDLIYFDAFDPEKQPGLWTPAVFQMLGNATKKGGILVTYSAKGAVKRALINAGFEVEKIPGPPGKREMIRGRKIDSLSPALSKGEGERKDCAK